MTDKSVQGIGPVRERVLKEVGEPIENQDEGYREIRIQDPKGYSLRFFAWNDIGRAGSFGAR